MELHSPVGGGEAGRPAGLLRQDLRLTSIKKLSPGVSVWILGERRRVRAFIVAEATIGEDRPGTFDNRRSILHQFLFRAKEGPFGEALASPEPVDECARGHGRAPVNKPAERLGTGILPCSAEDLSAFSAPSSRLTAAEALLHLGSPSRKERVTRHCC